MEETKRKRGKKELDAVPEREKEEETHRSERQSLSSFLKYKKRDLKSGRQAFIRPA